MTNIEKFLIEKCFELQKKEVKYYPIHTETILTYVRRFYEAKVYLYEPLGNNMNCCEIHATSLCINRFQTSDKDKPDMYASRKPELLDERTKEAMFLLELWATEMDEIKNPFDEVKEELKCD